MEWGVNRWQVHQGGLQCFDLQSIVIEKQFELFQYLTYQVLNDSCEYWSIIEQINMFQIS
jgi:hypothetical protein